VEILPSAHKHDIDDILNTFDQHPESDYNVADPAVLSELRSAAAAQREAAARIEAAVLSARREGLSWGVIGAQLGMTRQGARQRFDHLTTS
jgi:hypothetical protein